MHHSPKALIASLLALAALSLSGTPAGAHTVSHGPRRQGSSKQRTRTRKAAVKSGRSCRRADCADGTGGTPSGGAHAPRRERTAAKQTPAKPLAPAPSAPAEETPAKRDAADTAAVIAAVLATPCANTELTPTAENLPLVRDAVLCLINRERAEHGLNPLTANPRLETAAEEHCAELISDDYFAHISPSGETPVDRIRKTGYIPGPSVGYVIGENLAWGTYNLSTPKSIVAAWIASPGHLANILESQYTETGVGVVPAVPASLSDGSPGASYAQEFGVIIH